MSHFVMTAPPPEVPSEVHARAMAERLSIMPVKLTHGEIKDELAKIGDDWHLRTEHTDPSKVKATQRLLESSKTHTWFFMRGDQQIGFCCSVKGGFDGRLVEKYGLATKDTAEIYKVGLHREFTQQGLGQVFLPTIQAALFYGQNEIPELGIKAVKPSTAVYLNTRDSNLVDSRGFYDRLGYRMVGQEQIVDATSGQDLSFRLVPTEVADSETGVGSQDNLRSRAAPRVRRPLNSGWSAPRTAIGG